MATERGRKAISTSARLSAISSPRACSLAEAKAAFNGRCYLRVKSTLEDLRVA
jgi:hypothetical protein